MGMDVLYRHEPNKTRRRYHVEIGEEAGVLWKIPKYIEILRRQVIITSDTRLWCPEYVLVQVEFLSPLFFLQLYVTDIRRHHFFLISNNHTHFCFIQAFNIRFSLRLRFQMFQPDLSRSSTEGGASEFWLHFFATMLPGAASKSEHPWGMHEWKYLEVKVLVFWRIVGRFF